MKKKCLIIFSIPHVYNWEKEIIEKFNLIYDVQFVFANTLFYDGGTQNIINKCNEIISSKGIDVVVFDTDFLPFIDANVIKNIKDCTYKILITFDNLVHDNLNIINGSYCNLVLTCDPLDVYKFKEFNINSLFFTLEGSKNNYKQFNLEKDIDVLFYGDINKFGREITINHILNSGINLKVVGPPNNIVSSEELLLMINRSKIILNLSFTNTKIDFKDFFPPRDNELISPMLQFKGRFLQAGLCNTVCLSDYAPAIELLFSNMEVPTFKNNKECVEKISLLLNNDQLRNEITKNLNEKAVNYLEDEPLMNRILEEIIATRNSKPNGISINNFYKRYVTRFKISKLLFKPRRLFWELGYLFKNRLLKVTLDFIPFFFIRIYKALSQILNNRNK
jgi:hypothetical protein